MQNFVQPEKAPRSPNLSLWYGQAVDALIVAIISYFTALSLGRTFSFNSAVHYAIEPMQEAIAMGLGNALGSFFNIIPAMPSLSRSAIQVNNLSWLIFRKNVTMSL